MELLRRVSREQSSEQVGLAASGAAFWLVINAQLADMRAVKPDGP